MQKLRIIFPNDPIKRTRHKDLEAEWQLLEEYDNWSNNIEGKRREYRFWTGLNSAIMKDLAAVSKEVNDAISTHPNGTGLSPLQYWEWQFLDNDGGTTMLRTFLKEGMDVFNDYSRPAPEWTEGEQSTSKPSKDKYGYILKELPRVPQDDIETWKYHNMEKSGTFELRQVRSVNPFIIEPNKIRTRPTKHFFGGEAARDKSKHLLPPEPPVDHAVNEELDKKFGELLEYSSNMFDPEDIKAYDEATLRPRSNFRQKL